MYRENRTQLFPRRLSKDFHGIPKPKNKYEAKKNPQKPSEQFDLDAALSKITKHRQPVIRKHHEIQSERKQWIEHPAKISGEVPQWWTGTKNYYKRSEFSRLKREEQSKTLDYELDIFNRRKVNPNEIFYDKKDRFRITPRLSYKIGSQDRQLIMKNNSDITPKVGSVDTRDYSIRKPTLKVGTSSFVDTYSVF